MWNTKLVAELNADFLQLSFFFGVGMLWLLSLLWPYLILPVKGIIYKFFQNCLIPSSVIFPSGYPTKVLCAIIVSFMGYKCLSISSPIIWL